MPTGVLKCSRKYLGENSPKRKIPCSGTKQVVLASRPLTGWSGSFAVKERTPFNANSLSPEIHRPGLSHRDCHEF